MKLCRCGGKGVVRGSGGAAPHLDHSDTPKLFAVVCSRAVSSKRRCPRRTKYHPSKDEALKEWEGVA